MTPEKVKPPTRKQRFILRSMIVIGMGCMGFFMYSLIQPSIAGYKLLYWLLMSTFIFTLFKILYEWYHYWSISIPVAVPNHKTYTVDIFTTFCAGEPYEMIVETLTAIQAIHYPHQTYLCDEADDPYLKGVCNKLGVHHVTRAVKIDAKAGNINNALQQSTGELCVVLDPDHVPLANFLDPIISHFDDPRIGYVQIVQAYYNQDAGWIAKGAAQQTYQFYGPMMMCMNSYGTVQAIGANCTFRRTALDSIGGHAAGLAEDMNTAMHLHAKGWRSVYVPEVLARGLVPATLSAYYKQQLKWSRGVFELLVTSYIKFFKNFTWRQKLHYGLIPLFYLSGFIFLINFLLPIISLATDTYPLKMDFWVFIIISVPFITSVVLIRHYVQQWVMEDRERGFHIVGGLLLIGTWWVFILGFVYTLIRKNVPYIPTPKDIKHERNLKINLPNIFVLLVSLAAIAYGLYNDWNPFTFFMAGIAGLNCLFMVFILIASQELKLQVYKSNKPRLDKTVNRLTYLKEHFWLLRRKVYTGVRSVSLILVVLTLCITLYIGIKPDNDTGFSSYNTALTGVFDKHPTKPLVSKGTQSIPDKTLYEYMVPSTNVAVKDSVKSQTVMLAPNAFLSVRGVIYSKGLYWYKNIFPLNKKIILDDFTEMQKAGINTVKIYGPNIYDHSTLETAKQVGLKINYSFWIPDPSYFVNDIDHLQEVEKIIINTVNKYKNDPIIHAWNVGNYTFQKLDLYYKQPQLSYARYKYISWLNRLIQQIKYTDPSRKVTIDILSSPTLQQTVSLLHNKIPQIDAFSLVIINKAGLRQTHDLNVPYLFGATDPKVFASTPYPSGGIFYAGWQDQVASSAVTFDGVKDILGRNKSYLYKISESWHGKIAANGLPEIKILKPALTAVPGSSINYSALVYLYNKWNLAAYMQTGLKFDWYLVKTDTWGNPLSMNQIGNGPIISVKIPSNMLNYRLYLIASKGKNSSDAYSTLNIPLNN
jgi:cellulose synthase/poly-beta-1,6-N-acetylglucosamine synthase-like glycosyltransferase